MRINGEWLRCDDGVIRPVIPAAIRCTTDRSIECSFLVDTGADFTVLSAELFRDCGLTSSESPKILGGIGGVVETAQVHVTIELLKDDGKPITVAIDCFAFAADKATDIPILGRDILNLFTLVVDKESNLVCLLHGRHRAVIQES
jgi:predicted aspartyl protease